VEPLGEMLRFLAAVETPPMPALVNIGIVDDPSPHLPDVLNMLTRRNLLFRVVAAPDARLDLAVTLGSAEFPIASALDPSDFAARVRERLGDDRRLVRVFGTSSVIVHLTGDGRRMRVVVLSFARNRGTQRDVRLRLLGRHRPVSVAAYGTLPGASLADVANPDGGTEFTLPPFNTIAVIDLEALP
jgi:hypothetical protein